jgi:hypothetical protein
MPAKKPPMTAGLSPHQLERYCISLLEREGWRVTLGDDKIVGFDAIGEWRQRQGRSFVVGLECRTRIPDAAKLLNQLRQTWEAHAVDDDRLDEVWVVTPKVTDTARDLFEALEKQISIYSIEDFEDMLRRQGYVPKRRTRSVQPQTKIGRATLLNQKEIIAISGSLIAFIDDRIAALNASLLNDPDSIAKRDETVRELARLKERVRAFGLSVAQFKKGQGKEEDVVRSATSLAEGVQDWWSKSYMTICTSSFSVALFTSAVSVCSLAGVSMHGKTIALVAGAIAGGKPLVDSLKGLGKGLFR